MATFVVLAVLALMIAGPVNGYYSCTCYCSSSSSSAGTAYSSTCSSTACQTACLSQIYCASYYSVSGWVHAIVSLVCRCLSSFFRVCSDVSSGNTWDTLTTYSGALSTGAIVGTVVGALVGLAVLIGIIVTIIILCKRRPRQVWSLPQQQQQQMGQVSVIHGSIQQGPRGFYWNLPIGSMHNANQKSVWLLRLPIFHSNRFMFVLCHNSAWRRMNKNNSIQCVFMYTIELLIDA